MNRKASLGIGGHHRGHRGGSDIWLTPPAIIAALGPFDLDPCAAPDPRPWPTASAHFTAEDDGLSLPWSGRVWLNPPYGPETGRWLARLARHGDGIALTFARTETAMFHKYVWGVADALLFLRGRIHFHDATGRRVEANSGGPSVLIAYGSGNAARLESCGLAGAFIEPAAGSALPLFSMDS
jgi:hypothetical protein